MASGVPPIGRPSGCVPEDGGDEMFVGDVGGVVAVHRDFLEDDVAFLLHLLRVQDGAGDHVRDDVDGHRQVRVQHPGEVAGAFLGGGGVGFPADLIEGRGDFQGRAPLGAFEQQVLQEVGGAVLAGGLVAGADADPEADGRRPLAGHGLGQHPDAAGQDRTAHHGAAVGAVDRVSACWFCSSGRGTTVIKAFQKPAASNLPAIVPAVHGGGAGGSSTGPAGYTAGPGRPPAPPFVS